MSHHRRRNYRHEQEVDGVLEVEDRKDHETSATHQLHEATDVGQSDIALVEKAYVYLTKGTYPEGANKNDKRSIRRKAERLKEQNGELYYKKRGGVEVSDFRNKDSKKLSCADFYRCVSSLTLENERKLWNHATSTQHLGTWDGRERYRGLQRGLSLYRLQLVMFARGVAESSTQ